MLFPSLSDYFFQPLSKGHCFERSHHATACKDVVFYGHYSMEKKVRNLTQTERQIVGLLAHGIRPKRTCEDVINLLWDSALASR